MPVFPLSSPTAADAVALFMSRQLTPAPGHGLDGRRIVVLGLLPSRHGRACGGDGSSGVDALRLCARLLQRGGQLVVLDRPRNQLLIGPLLALAADGRGQVRGRCLLESDLSSAFRDAAAALVLPGWPAARSLAWGVLAGRMRPGGHLFDLRPGAHLDRPAARGLQVWRVGDGFAAP